MGKGHEYQIEDGNNGLLYNLVYGCPQGGIAVGKCEYIKSS